MPGVSTATHQFGCHRSCWTTATPREIDRDQRGRVRVLGMFRVVAWGDAGRNRGDALAGIRSLAASRLRDGRAALRGTPTRTGWWV